MRVLKCALATAALLLAALRLAAGQEEHPETGHQLITPPEELLSPPGEVWGQYPKEASVPPAFVLTNASMYSILDRISAPMADSNRRAVIFTALRFGDSAADVIGMVSTFCYHLHRQGFLAHTMLITTDEATFSALLERGFPAYLDRAFPRRSAYVEHVRVGDSPNREFDVQKHWWGWRMASLGYRVVYMDSDAAVMGDILAPFSHPFGYDVQGLTDWSPAPGEQPELVRGFTLRFPCILYYIKPSDASSTQTMWTESWTLPPGHPFPLAPNPCQSTGTWFLEPTPPAVAFMAALVDRIAYHHVEEWDQTAWNDVLLHFLWGTGDDDAAPVKYRLLPFSSFCNLGLRLDRQERGLPMSSIVIHLGGIHGHDKQRAFQEQGIWEPDFVWDPENDPAMAALPRTKAAVEFLQLGRRVNDSAGIFDADVLEEEARWGGYATEVPLRWMHAHLKVWGVVAATAAVVGTVFVAAWRLQRRSAAGHATAGHNL